VNFIAGVTHLIFILESWRFFKWS